MMTVLRSTQMLYRYAVGCLKKLNLYEVAGKVSEGPIERIMLLIAVQVGVI